MNNATRKLFDLLMENKAPVSFRQVENMIAQGAELDAVISHLDSSLLHIAVQNNHLEAVSAFLKAGVDIEKKDMNGETALHMAADEPEMTLLLLKAGANARAVCHRNRSPLHTAAEINGAGEVISALIAAGAEVDIKEYGHQNTALLLAIKHKSLDVADALLTAGADVRVNNQHAQTPLHAAAQTGLDTLVPNLVKAGARVEALNIWSHSPLLQAVKENQILVMRALLHEGASVWSTKNKPIPVDKTLSQYIERWSKNLKTGFTPATRDEVMKLVSVMPVENGKPIPEPLIRAKILLDGMPQVANTLFEMVLGTPRSPQVGDLNEARANASQRGAVL